MNYIINTRGLSYRQLIIATADMASARLKDVEKNFPPSTIKALNLIIKACKQEAIQDPLMDKEKATEPYKKLLGALIIIAPDNHTWFRHPEDTEKVGYFPVEYYEKHHSVKEEDSDDEDSLDDEDDEYLN